MRGECSPKTVVGRRREHVARLLQEEALVKVKRKEVVIKVECHQLRRHLHGRTDFFLIVQRLPKAVAMVQRSVVHYSLLVGHLHRKRQQLSLEPVKVQATSLRLLERICSQYLDQREVRRIGDL